MTKLSIRRGRPEDAPRCGQICFEAFSAISAKHNFPPDFPTPDAAIGLLSWMLAQADVYSIVAEMGGQIVGSNFLWENGPIAGVGPITVDPSLQNASIGRRMMEEALTRGQARGFAGVRLVQAGFHCRSLSLYAKLGFIVREPLVVMNGTYSGGTFHGYKVRPAEEADITSCNELCCRVHGHHRDGELRGAIAQNTATIVERHSRITGYATQIGFFGHAVGETNHDLQPLIGLATQITGPGFIVPVRRAELFQWCLQNGFRVVQPLNLMTVGLYSEPAGGFMPSILF